ncbi:hypothetical protein QBC35DRAFT_234232 [Podospora australis]|uniref:Uncharacterized protein n=1 Tax=Podospora australis TaxID=1536484 RepID=A0AAN7AJ12_9PEZI|nr:hypothetical protein QBC35DRAFT_234232 [Podospora australis]
MAPLNGVADKPTTTVRRAASTMVVPVLPLNYPQRPVKKPVAPAPPVASTPTDKVPEEKPAVVASQDSPEPETATTVNAAAEPNIATEGNNSATPAAAPVHTASEEEDRTATAETTAAVADDLTADTDTVRAAPSEHAAVPSHSSGPPNPAFNNGLSSAAPVPELPIPAPHPAMLHRPVFHQARPSNGSLMFGYYESNASSPVPFSGSGVFPPPGMVPRPPVTAMPATDAYGRPLMVSPSLDGFPAPPFNQHGPPTPHSFQGSQTSAQAEDQGYNPFPAANGLNGYHSSESVAQTPVPPPGMNPTLTNGSAAVYRSLQEQEETLAYLRHAINDDTFSDCFLEVRFAESRDFQDHPMVGQLKPLLRTPAHRMVLARSPRLYDFMKNHHVMPLGGIYLDVVDDYIRPDVFWYTLRTLYGWGLGEGYLPTDLQYRGVKDEFKTALSYIAAGRYLQLQTVQAVATQRASRLIYWDTIEEAVRFISRNAALSPDGYPDVPEFTTNVLTWLVHNFPLDFVIDYESGDFGFSRLPPTNTPSMVNGTSGGLHSRQPSKTQAQAQIPRHPRGSSNPRLSQIKFGDMTPSKNGYHAGNQPPSSRPVSQNPAQAVFSRILLNLPFSLLKTVLEHPLLCKTNGELSRQAREAVIDNIISARETRRKRTFDQGDEHLRPYQTRVQSERQPLVVKQMEDFWLNSMGFKEEAFNGDVPYLLHKWIFGDFDHTS